MVLFPLKDSHAKKTMAVDSDMIDLATDELSKLLLRLERKPRKQKSNTTQLRKLKRFGIQQI